jgi:ribosomal protein L13E
VVREVGEVSEAWAAWEVARPCGGSVDDRRRNVGELKTFAL